MARHFLSLYLLIVLTLAAVSWGQDKLLQTSVGPGAADDRSEAVALSILQTQLRGVPADDWKHEVADTAAKTGVGMELFATTDIAGGETLRKLKNGEIAYMQSASGERWALKQLNGAYVLALKSFAPETQRSPMEWALTLLFYAAIATTVRPVIDRRTEHGLAQAEASRCCSSCNSAALSLSASTLSCSPARCKALPATGSSAMKLAPSCARQSAINSGSRPS